MIADNTKVVVLRVHEKHNVEHTEMMAVRWTTKYIHGITSYWCSTIVLCSIMINAVQNGVFAEASYTTFPAPSINLQDAYDVKMYVQPQLEDGERDPHPVLFEADSLYELHRFQCLHCTFMKAQMF